MKITTNRSFEEIITILETIANNNCLKIDTNKDIVFLYNSKLKIECQMKGKKLLIYHETETEDNPAYSIIKAFLPVTIFVFFIAIYRNETFFLIEKIIYSFIGIILLFLTPLIAKIVSFSFISNTELEKKVRKIKDLIKSSVKN